jgi:nucleoside 2-deoxyribosyltransferase
MKSLKVVYIAGPFRANSAWDVERNIRRAEELALWVWRAGAVALCPHTNTRFFQGAADDDIWLKGDLELLRRCDAVLLVASRETSAGTLDEILYACDNGIPVFNYLVNFKLWLEYGIIKEVQSEIKAKAIQLREARRAQAGAGA